MGGEACWAPTWGFHPKIFFKMRPEAIKEAEAVQAVAIREVKACYANIIQDAKATCARTIRKVKTACTEHACTLQQAHRDSMEGLEREAINEEEQDCQSFLTACGVALQICPPGACRVLMYPLQLLMGNMSGCPLGHLPPTLHQNVGTCPYKSPPNHSSRAHTLLGNQTAMPFAQLKGNLAMVRGWRKHRDIWGAASPQGEKWDASC